MERNKPCFCGSGKKYKKCCLAKNKNKRRNQRKGSPNTNAIETAIRVMKSGW